MLVMLALTMMLPLDAFDAVAYAADYDANAEVKMPNAACHLHGAYVVVLMTTLMMSLRELMLVIMQ